MRTAYSLQVRAATLPFMSEFSGAGDIDVSLALLWGLREEGKRGRKPSISLEAIVAKAVEIADTEDLEAVSMRRIAADLAVGTMSLYRHVPGKSELLDLMIDHVQVTTASTDDSAGWRAQVEETARNLYQLYLQHPWLLQVDQSRPLLGPNSVHSLELSLQSLDEVPLTPQEKVMLVVTVDATISGLARLQVQHDRAEARTGVSDTEFWSTQAPVLEELMTTERYPIVSTLPMEAFEGSWEAQLDFALSALLDGFEQKVTDRGT